MANVMISTYEAKTHLSRLLAACEQGDDVTITRGVKPVARLVAVDATPRRDLGFLDLRLSDASVAESMAPLDEDILPDWYSGPVA